MKVYFVGAGPGDPELLTVKARRLLEHARLCIYAGSLINPQIVELLPSAAQRYDSAGMDLQQIIALVQRAQQQNVDVMRLHTGEPAIYGAIGEQMDALDRLGIDYEVVPGISAFQAAAAALKKELTLPEVSQTVILTRTAGRTPMPAGQELERLAATGATLCVFLSTQQIKHVAQVVAAHYGPACPVAMVHHASWPDQRIITGTAADIAEQVHAAGLKQTAIILAGPALSGQGPKSKLYDKSFTHGFREGQAT